MKSKLWKVLLCLALCALMVAPMAVAEVDDGENDGDAVYTMVDANGRSIARRAGRMYVGDGLIASDNTEYVVTAVDDEHRIAYAEVVEDSQQTSAIPVIGSAAKEAADDVKNAGKNAAEAGKDAVDGVIGAGKNAVDGIAEAGKDAAEAGKNAVEGAADKAKSGLESATGGDKKVICLYCTHSDESYEPTDGDFSLKTDAGIYDVSEALKQSFEKLGVTVERSEETFLPHDSGAYRRSRSTAAEYAKMMPDAIFDIHRDGIPDASEYEETVDGKEIAQVRLLVGRSNENSQVNKDFAKQIKAVADEKYPGLIRDIFIGKGNYNQELYPRALLLEFGTYSNDKDIVLKSTDMMADTISTTLFGAQSAKAQEETKSETNKGALKGVAWVVGVALVAGLIYALVATGTLKNFGQKFASGTGELTGGLFGGKRKDGEK